MTENIVIAIAVLVLLLVIFAIPLLIQVRRTVRGMEQTLGIINRDLPAIMKNLEEITTNINMTTTTVKSEVAELSTTLKRIQGVTGVFLGAADVLRHRISVPLVGGVTTAMAVFKGIRAFVEVFRKAPSSESQKT